MKIVFYTATWPIVVVETAHIDQADWYNSFIGGLEALLARQEPFILLVDTTDAKRWGATQLRHYASFRRRNKQELGRCVGVSVLIRSDLVRTAFAAIMWAQPAAAPVAACATLDDAITSAVERCRTLGIETRDTLGQEIRAYFETLGRLEPAADATPVAIPLTAEDSDLVAGLKNEDGLCFTALIDRYADELRHVSENYVDNPEAADEVLQDTWLSIIDNLNEYRGDVTVRTWLSRIVANKSRRYSGRRNGKAWRRVGNDATLARFSRAGDDTADNTALDSPEYGARRAEALRRFSKALDSLPLMQRRVLMLCDIEGLSPEEVCAALQISEGNQRVLLHRARAKMRDALLPPETRKTASPGLTANVVSVGESS